MLLAYVLIVILFILLLFLFACKKKKIEGLENKPTDKEKEIYISLILENKHLFAGNNSLNSVKRKLPWIDVVIFEEARLLAKNGKLNEQTLHAVFSSHKLSGI